MKALRLLLILLLPCEMYAQSTYQLDLPALCSSCVIIADTMTPSACKAYLSPSGNKIWTQSGMYLDTLQHAELCDTVVTVDLTVTNLDTAIARAGDSLVAQATGVNYQWIDCQTNQPIAGETGKSLSLTQPGEYAVIITQNNCSDTSTCFEVLCTKQFKTISTTACSPYTSPSGKFVWTADGTYHDTLSTTIGGCDSILEINLTITKFDTSITRNADTLISNATGVTYQWIDCDNGQHIGGATDEEWSITQPGNYAVIITDTVCSDTSECFQVLCVAQEESINPSECDTYITPSGNDTLTSSGTYYDTISTKHGACDSVIEIHLDIITVQALAQINGDTLFTTTTGDGFQWIDCQTKQPISGATDSFFLPSQAGTYAVVVSKSGCSDTSSCIITSIENPLKQQVTVFPNPTKDAVVVDIADPIDQLTAVVFNPQGQEVSRLTFHQATRFTVPLPPVAGTYTLQLYTPGGESTSFTIIRQ